VSPVTSRDFISGRIIFNETARGFAGALGIGDEDYEDPWYKCPPAIIPALKRLMETVKKLSAAKAKAERNPRLPAVFRY
jgi:hypothetical protein